MSETVGAVLQDTVPWSMGSVVRTLLVTPVILYLLHLWYKRRKLVAAIEKIPGPNLWEIIVKAKGFIYDFTAIFRWIQEQHLKHDGLWKVWLFNRPQLMCCDARMAEVVLKGSTNIEKSRNYYIFEYWMGIGPFTARGEEWRRQRKFLQPLFLQNSLQHFMPIFTKHAYKMCELLEKKIDVPESPVLDVFQHTCMCAFDIICDTSLGVEMDCQENDDKQFIFSFDNLMRLTLWRYINMPLKWDTLFNISPTKKEMDKTLEKLNFLADTLTEKRLAQLEVLQENAALDDPEDIHANVKLFTSRVSVRNKAEFRKDLRGFLFAGYDTVATAMGWFIFNLAANPECQEKLAEEMYEIFGDTGRAPDATDLGNMKYLDRCIKESLRLNPSAPFFERELAGETKLGDYVVPGGVAISFDLYRIHRDPEWWTDPETFDPDRFLPENSQGRHPYAYMPFCIGPRNCIGMLYAQMELKIVMSTIFRRFRIEVAKPQDYNNLKIGFLMRPRGGLKMRVYERTSHPYLRMQAP